MSSKGYIEALPIENIEAIANLLDLASISHLRQTSRQLAAKASQGKFRTYFASKRVRLSNEAQLAEFVYMTHAERPGQYVQHLTIVAVVPDADTSSDNHVQQVPTASDLLTEAFLNLHRNSSHCSLRSLSTEIEGRSDGGIVISSDQIRMWQRSWTAADQAWQTMLSALHSSTLAIENLNVFASINRCSLAINRIRPMRNQDVKATLAHLRQFSLSLSPHVVKDRSDDTSTSSQTGREHAESVGKLLEQMPNLDCLDLHWFNLPPSGANDAWTEERGFFDSMMQSCHLKRLTDCSLRGVHVSEASLLTLVQGTTLRRLTLQNVHLKPGKFRPVFDQVIPKLEFLHLDDLWEDRHLFFDGPGSPHFPSSKASGPNELTRSGEDAKKPIKYKLASGHSLGSPSLNNWLRKRRLLYGPP